MADNEKVKLSDFCREIQHGDVLISVYRGKIITVRRQKIKRDTRIPGVTAHFDVDRDIEVDHD